MKKVLLPLIICAIFFSSCASNTTNHFFPGSIFIELKNPPHAPLDAPPQTGVNYLSFFEWTDPDYDPDTAAPYSIGDLRIAIYVFSQQPQLSPQNDIFENTQDIIAGVYLDTQASLENTGSYSLQQLMTFNQTTFLFDAGTKYTGFVSATAYYWIATGFTNAGFISHSSEARRFVWE